MVVRKTKKVTKYRAHTTHGGGHRKKRRGAGSRGGRGNAGSGKRAGHKPRSLIGKYGFTSVKSKLPSCNVSYFTLHCVEDLLKKGKIQKEGDAYVIMPASLGFQKILGSGHLAVKLRVEGPVTPRAREKIEGAGGTIV